MTDERTLDNIVETAIESTTSGKKNVVLDATLLTTLMTGGRLADLRFNHNLQSIEGKGNSLECGSIVHVFLEKYYKSIINGVADRNKAFGFGISAAELYIAGCPSCTGFTPTHHLRKEISNNELVEETWDGHVCSDQCIIKPKCGHQVDEFPGVKNTPPEDDKWHTGWKWVLTTCEQYHDFYRNDHWVPLETEIVKGKILYEDDDLRILWKAKLDLTADTNQGIFPIDHKTMKQNRPTLSLNNQFIGQCIISDTRSVFINKVGFQKTLEPKDKFVRAMLSYSGARLMEWQSEILPYWAYKLVEYAETGYWAPNFNSCEGRYGKCAMFEVCSSDPNMREEVIRNNFMVGKEWNPTND
jgi:hypothetical protein